MTENQNSASEQKEKIQKYILDNLDKYNLDTFGNFVNIDFDTYGTEYFCISEGALSNREEVIREIEKMILQNKNDWEVILDYTGYYIKNKRDGRVMYESAFGFTDNSDEGFVDRGYDIVGELGYRKSIWKDYEKNKKWKEEWLKSQREWKGQFSENYNSEENNTQPTSPRPNQKNHERKKQNPTPPSENNPREPNKEKENPEKETNNPNKPDKNTPSSNQDNSTSQPTNSPLPPPADIQNQHNSDKAQVEINLTNQEAKNQAQQLLKLIITAELLIKENKFNSEILTKLLNEKNQNSSVYQLLNEENRIDQAISQLENINSATNNQNQQNKSSSPFKIIIPVGLSLLIIVGIAVLVTRKKKKL